MPVINVVQFAGERPKLAPHLLPNENATKAHNCDFEVGTLRPYKGALDTSDSVSAMAKTIYRYADLHWLYWSKDVDVVLSPIAQDPWGRVYYTGDGYPKVTNNQIIAGDGAPINYRLGVPAPDTRLNGVVNPPSPVPDKDSPDDDETRFYVYTWLTGSGEEGPPSPISNQLEIKYPNSTVDLTLPALGTQSSNITKRRIYRSATGGGVAGFFLVAELAPSALSYTDSLTVSELGQQLESEGYEMPNEKMTNLTLMPNGIVAGSFDNSVCFSEPFLPHAWNPAYRLTTQYDIVAMAAVGNTLVVGTKGYPEIFQGVSPDSMSGRKLSSKQACVSKRSMKNIDNLIVYAAPSGLVAFDGSDVKLVTGNIIKKEQWEALQPETIEAYYYDGNYLAFYGAGLNKAFIFNPVRQDIVFFDLGFDTAFEKLVTGELLVKKNDGTIANWNKGTNLNVTFKSKEYRNLYPTFSTIYVLSEDNTKVGLRIYADGALVHDYHPTKVEDVPFRIPPARGKVWQFEAYGDVEITRVCLATSVAEVYG
ncbi:hypothetical protein [Vibrio owensii]|uniref:hypothetical protein n=1 Tax=Vibrio owensii TaxID=696485 RepID=UPI003CE5A7ED